MGGAPTYPLVPPSKFRSGWKPYVFVLLPRRRIVERSFAWAARFRRLAQDYERLPGTVGGCTS